MSDLEDTAYHEAGHVFVAVYLGARIRIVTLEPDRDDLPDRFGDTQIEWTLGQFTDRQLHGKCVLVALAGPAAEMIYRGEPCHPGFVPEWAEDWREAWKTAAQLFPNERDRVRYLEQATAQLYRLLRRDDHWTTLASIVDHLLAHETLDREMIEDIIGGTLR